jgi:hypothetical protein
VRVLVAPALEVLVVRVDGRRTVRVDERPESCFAESFVAFVAGAESPAAGRVVASPAAVSEPVPDTGACACAVGVLDVGAVVAGVVAGGGVAGASAVPVAVSAGAGAAVAGAAVVAGPGPGPELVLAGVEVVAGPSWPESAAATPAVARLVRAMAKAVPSTARPNARRR